MYYVSMLVAISQLINKFTRQKSILNCPNGNNTTHSRESRKEQRRQTKRNIKINMRICRIRLFIFRIPRSMIKGEKQINRENIQIEINRTIIYKPN